MFYKLKTGKSEGTIINTNMIVLLETAKEKDIEVHRIVMHFGVGVETFVIDKKEYLELEYFLVVD